MSSASSEPGDGDSTSRSRLGLDAVIQVSGVAALRHLLLGPPGHLGGRDPAGEATPHPPTPGDTFHMLTWSAQACVHTHTHTVTHTGAHTCRLDLGQGPEERLNWGPRDQSRRPRLPGPCCVSSASQHPSLSLRLMAADTFGLGKERGPSHTDILGSNSLFFVAKCGNHEGLSWRSVGHLCPLVCAHINSPSSTHLPNKNNRSSSDWELPPTPLSPSFPSPRSQPTARPASTPVGAPTATPDSATTARQSPPPLASQGSR